MLTKTVVGSFLALHFEIAFTLTELNTRFSMCGSGLRSLRNPILLMESNVGLIHCTLISDICRASLNN